MLKMWENVFLCYKTEAISIHNVTYIGVKNNLTINNWCKMK